MMGQEFVAAAGLKTCTRWKNLFFLRDLNVVGKFNMVFLIKNFDLGLFNRPL